MMTKERYFAENPFVVVVVYKDDDQAEIFSGPSTIELRERFKEWARYTLPLEELEEYKTVLIKNRKGTKAGHISLSCIREQKITDAKSFAAGGLA